MSVLMTYSYKKRGTDISVFFHKVVDDALLEIMQMQLHGDGDYRLINVLEIDEDKYLTQSLESIKNVLDS